MYPQSTDGVIIGSRQVNVRVWTHRVQTVWLYVAGQCQSMNPQSSDGVIVRSRQVNVRVWTHRVQTVWLYVAGQCQSMYLQRNSPMFLYYVYAFAFSLIWNVHSSQHGRCRCGASYDKHLQRANICLIHWSKFHLEMKGMVTACLCQSLCGHTSAVTAGIPILRVVSEFALWSGPRWTLHEGQPFRTQRWIE